MPLAIAATVLASCGTDDDRAPGLGGTSDSGAAADAALCRDYCATLVNEAPGCEKYNEGSRCERICGFYMNSVCREPYEDFVVCMQQPGSAQCAEPSEASSAGRLVLNVRRCHGEHEGWNACIHDNDAGFCPY